MRSSRHTRVVRATAFTVAVLMSFGLVPLVSAEGGRSTGFITALPAMLDPVAPGVRVKKIISVGETAGEAAWYADSLMDGIAINPLSARGRGGARSVQIFLNHETSLVPFLGLNDLTNSQVSAITLNRKTGGVLDARFVIPSSANYQRFCSNFLATREHGFDRPILFTNEEAQDIVNRTGAPLPVNAAQRPEQAGVVVAYDVKSGAYRTIYGMGRHNHENSVAIPGYRKIVVLSGDDTFNAPASQLYSYIATNRKAVWNDKGKLYAFVSNNPAINDYGDLSGRMSVSGKFIEVRRDIATGKDAAGNEISGPADYPSGHINGPQRALENWSNDNNVFQFIRVEDIAYDRNNPRIVYIADSGEPRARPFDPVADALYPDYATRLFRGATANGQFPNGRIWKMVLDRRDPTKVRSLSILIDGDALGAAGSGNVSLIHQPDNLETTKKALLIQEDPGSHNQYALSNTAGTTARIWKYDLRTKSLIPVARVNQSIDNAGTPGPNNAPPPIPAIPGVPVDTQATIASKGGWESSGIIDASKWFGKGWFLVDVQAGSYVPYFEMKPVGGVEIRHEREGGQLLLVKIPGT